MTKYDRENPELNQLIVEEVELFRSIRRRHTIQIVHRGFMTAVGEAGELQHHDMMDIRLWASAYVCASPDKYIVGSSNHGAFRITPESSR